jgi:nitrogen regulatory protein P-II 1
MKLLEAFVRTDRVEDVVRALEQARAPGITLSRVHGVGYGYDPYLFTLAPSEVQKTPEVSKVEVVCRSEDLDRFLDILIAAARTGTRGDGIVFVTPVERAIKIRTGAEGPSALATP